jgi:hypothetical protein
MSRVLERDPGLTILRLWVGIDPNAKGTGRSRNEPHQVVFWQVQVPGAPADPAVTIRPEELGLPRSFEDARRFRYGEPHFLLPEELAMRLKARLDERDDTAAALWLELAQPSGTLSLVPWERLLQPTLSLPVFRIPFFAIPAVANPIIGCRCASSPVAKQPIDIEELLGRIIEQAIRSLPDDSNLHIFTDVRSFPEMSERLRGRAVRQSSHRIFLYDPRQSASLFRRHRTIEEDPENRHLTGAGPSRTRGSVDLTPDNAASTPCTSWRMDIWRRNRVPSHSPSRRWKTATKAGRASSVRPSCPHSLPASEHGR